MFFKHQDSRELEKSRYEVARDDITHPLSAYAPYAFELDGAEWPSVEHYYQAMKFEDAEYRELIRAAENPARAAKLGKARFKKRRKDWKKNSVTYMTRGTYIKCRTHTELTDMLLATEELDIKDLTMYDYFWGSGRDMRGQNCFGKMLMGVRQKLKQEGTV